MNRDRPWIMRTYAGHSTAAASNALYRRNLKKGQTGLSVAFDLPTQTGYDADDQLSRGEVGKVGVPISHLGDMRALMNGIPVGEMNTSMTINATAPWLLALYLGLAEERGIPFENLRGTTQNDLVKEYLSRGTYVLPPSPSLRLTTDLIAYAVEHVPKWNPINICSYHLQEAGATPVQELSYALAAAISVLDKTREKVPAEAFPKVVGRISFFVNAGIRFVEEVCKMRAFVELWDRITKERYGVEDPKLRRFRYGIQVNSLGLTEQQPENNILRIVIEMLGVTLSKDARARAIQLPAWNEALGLPRPWDQQWSLRAQQILAFETDLLEYPDLFTGSVVIEKKTRELVEAASAEIDAILERGGAIEAIESGFIKRKLVESNAARMGRIERGEQVVVGVNQYTEGEPSPLVGDLDGAILTVDDKVELEQIASLREWRSARDADAHRKALDALKAAAASDTNIMPASIAAARAGVTTGEWGAAMREVFGEYRAPTGVAGGMPQELQTDDGKTESLRLRLDRLTNSRGRRPKLLVGKPGLDGHSNGAEQIALKARDVGFDVVYEGIRVSPEQIAGAALEEGADLIGLSILSGSHMTLVPDVLARLKETGVEVPIVVGGIIPDSDAEELRAAGIARVFTPKDFSLVEIMTELVNLLETETETSGA